MTPAQHRALELAVDLADAGSYATPGDRTGRTGDTTATIDRRTVDALVRRGLVERRFVELVLEVAVWPTSDGRQLAATSAPIGETR